MEMNYQEFRNKEVEITIERDGENFAMISSDSSPIQAYGTLQQIKENFLKITENTIKSMKLNNSNKIVIHASWE
jgi:hypothetical protein